jgi:hypothetical protein
MGLPTELAIFGPIFLSFYGYALLQHITATTLRYLTLS